MYTKFMYEPFTYVITNTRTIDGDTVVVDIDMGFGIWQKNVHVRLYGLNCPEKNTPEGVAAKNATTIWMTSRNSLVLRVVENKKDKYGRILGIVNERNCNDDATLNRYLLSNGHAKEYFGGKKE